MIERLKPDFNHFFPIVKRFLTGEYVTDGKRAYFVTRVTYDDFTIVLGVLEAPQMYVAYDVSDSTFLGFTVRLEV